MAKKKANPTADEIYRVLADTALDSDSAHLHGVLAEGAAELAKLYGAPMQVAWAKLELRIVCRPFLRDHARDRRDVYLYEVSAEGVRNSLLYKTDATLTEWLHLIQFAQAIGAKLAPEPIGADSPNFEHPDWSTLPKTGG